MCRKVSSLFVRKLGKPRATQVMDGKVKWFSSEKGYGFISVPEMEDFFFHVSQVKGNELPNIGDEVTFSAVSGKNGKPAADDVVITGRQSPKPKTAYYGKPTYVTVPDEAKKPELAA